MPTKSCFNCGYRSLNPQQCPLIGYAYTEDRNQYCPYWVSEVPYCDICKGITPNYAFTKTKDDSWIKICPACAQKSGTCGLCSHGGTCDFETNASTVPKVIQKQIRQGNQIMVTTVPNPERIRVTCQENCECFSEEFGCLRENGTCGKYKGAI